MGKYDDNSGKIVRQDMLYNGSMERNPTVKTIGVDAIDWDKWKAELKIVQERAEERFRLTGSYEIDLRKK